MLLAGWPYFCFETVELIVGLAASLIIGLAFSSVVSIASKITFGLSR